MYLTMPGRIKKDLDIEEWISLLVEREIERGIHWSQLNLSKDAPFRLCYLCTTEYPMSKLGFEQHCKKDAHHQERVKEINTYMKIRKTVGARWKTAGQLNDRIKQLGLPRWQADVEKILYNYISIDSEDEIDSTNDYCWISRNNIKKRPRLKRP